MKLFFLIPVCLLGGYGLYKLYKENISSEKEDDRIALCLIAGLVIYICTLF